MDPMRHPLALALALIFIPAAACAQRGSSHGGGFSAPHASGLSQSAPAFSSHSAPAFRGNFTAATPYRPNSGPLVSGRAGGAAIPFRNPGPVYGSSSTFRIRPAAARPPFYTRDRGTHRSRYGYGAGVPYAYPVWLGPSYFDDSADESDDSADTTTPDTQAYADIQPDQTYPPMAGDAPQPMAQPTPSETDAVTLIFKDGRPPQQVRNYALTRTTLYVIGAHHRDIPVADLDLAATEKVNREAGVAFQLPQPTP